MMRVWVRWVMDSFQGEAAAFLFVGKSRSEMQYLFSIKTSQDFIHLEPKHLLHNHAGTTILGMRGDAGFFPCWLSLWTDAQSEPCIKKKNCASSSLNN